MKSGEKLLFYKKEALMKKILFLILVVAIGYSCNKDSYEFPYAQVNYYIYPNNAVYNGLHFPGGSSYIEGGVNGILIFHDYFGNYIAYDRACTNDPLNSCAQVSMNENNPNMLSCNCCESEFFIFDGGVTKGPARQALHRYRTQFDGVRLRILN